MIAYALRGMTVLLLALMLVLMVCGALYIKEHLTRGPDSEPSAEHTDMDDSAPLEPPVIPIEPVIPGEAVIPDQIVQDMLPIHERARPETVSGL